MGGPLNFGLAERELLVGRGGQERRLGLELRADVAGRGVWIQPCLERLARECFQPAEAPSRWPESQRPTPSTAGMQAVQEKEERNLKTEWGAYR